MTWLRGWIIAWTFLELVSPVHADKPTSRATPSANAKTYLERGLELYGAKDYEAAILEFQRAYELEPGVRVLFAWAQAERLRGNCPKAAQLYRKILDENPNERQERVTRAQLARCEELLKESAPQESAPASPPQPQGAAANSRPPGSLAAPEAPPENAPPARSADAEKDVTPVTRVPWYKDWVGDTLLGVGLAGLTVGTLFFLSSQSDEDAAHRAATSDEWKRRISDAESNRTLSWVAFAGGSALVVAAMLRYVFRPAAGNDRRVAFWLEGNGGGLTWQQPY